MGATLKCNKLGCNHSYHYPCAIKSSKLYPAKKKFSHNKFTYCKINFNFNNLKFREQNDQRYTKHSVQISFFVT